LVGPVCDWPLRPSPAIQQLISPHHRAPACRTLTPPDALTHPKVASSFVRSTWTSHRLVLLVGPVCDWPLPRSPAIQPLIPPHRRAPACRSLTPPDALTLPQAASSFVRSTGPVTDWSYSRLGIGRNRVLVAASPALVTS